MSSGGPGNSRQKAFFVQGWFTYTLYKLQLAEFKELHPVMADKIRMHNVENNLQWNDTFYQSQLNTLFDGDKI